MREDGEAQLPAARHGSRPRRTIAVRVLCGLVGFTTLAACGSISAAGSSSPASLTEAAASTAAQLREVSAELHGVPEDTRAVEWLQFQAFQVPLGECMASYGHDYREPMFSSLAAARDSATIPDTFHALAELPVSDHLVPSVAADEAARVEQLRSYRGPTYPAEPSLAYQNALSRCGADAFSPEWPQPDADLAARLFEVMERAVADPVVVEETAKYPACMSTELGADVVDQIDLYLLVHSKYTPFLAYYYDRRATPGPDTERAWAEAVEFEARAAAADRVCRTAAHEAALAAIAPLLDRFRSENAAELAANVAAWAELRERAEAAGFSPSRE